MDKDSWAESKVRNYFRPCREKITLLAIAVHASRGGDGVWISYPALSRETGQSVRTIRRHVKSLVLAGDLVTWCDRKRSRDSNFFFIPIAQETEAELEERTGIARRQLKLPIVQRDRAGGQVPIAAQYVPAAGPGCPSPRDKMAHKNKSSEQNHMNNRNFSSEKAVDTDYSLEGPMSEETAGLLREAMEKLRVSVEDYSTPTRPGTRLRARLYGEEVAEEAGGADRGVQGK